MMSTAYVDPDTAEEGTPAGLAPLFGDLVPEDDPTDQQEAVEQPTADEMTA